MGQQKNYRPDIDGLRAVAVLSVVLYHFGLDKLPGGFAGVDIFFVISGFLITSIVQREIVEDRFTLSGFYRRRVRRILPALLVVVVTSLMAGFFLLMPGDYEALGWQAVLSITGMSNVYFKLKTGYFDQAAEMLPLLHTWSLAIEEQFYLVWPIWLAFVAWVAGRRLHIAGIAVAGAAIVSLILAAYWVANAPVTAFYSPFARAWELAVGALLVFMPPLRQRWMSEGAALIGCVLIGWALVALTASDPFPGLGAVAPCIGAALVIWPRPNQTLPARVLSLRPLVAVGLVSYSLYLWHWPILVFYRHYNNGLMPDTEIAVALLLVTLAISVLSWRFVERPFRRLGATAGRTVRIVLSASACVAVAGMVLAGTSGLPARVPESVRGMESLDAMWAWDCPHSVEIPDWGKACQFGADWTTAANKGFLWGDSHAEHMAPVLESVAGDNGFILARSCPAFVDAGFIVDNDSVPGYAAMCDRYKSVAVSYLATHPDIKLIVLAASWSFLLPKLHLPQAKAGDVDKAASTMAQGLNSLIAEIASPGRRIVLVGDVPSFHGSGSALCSVLQPKIIQRDPCSSDTAGASQDQFMAEQGMVIEMFDAIARDNPAVSVIRTGAAMCATGQCITTLNGEFLYRDAGHIRRNLRPDTLRALAQLIGFELPPVLRTPS